MGNNNNKNKENKLKVMMVGFDGKIGNGSVYLSIGKTYNKDFLNYTINSYKDISIISTCVMDGFFIKRTGLFDDLNGIIFSIDSDVMKSELQQSKTERFYSEIATNESWKNLPKLILVSSYTGNFTQDELLLKLNISLTTNDKLVFITDYNEENFQLAIDAFREIISK